MTCPECKAIQLSGNKCKRCSFNFETKEFEYDILKGKKCPNCGSERIIAWRSWKSPAPKSIFRVMPLVECLDCEKVWEPSASALVLGLGALFGLGIFGLGVVMFSMAQTQSSAPYFLMVVGGIAFAGCLWRFTQRGK